jgi:hypothetical protein
MTVFLANSLDIIFLSLIAGTGLTITCLKLFKTRALKYDYIFDVIITLGLPLLFGGGFHAMTIAILSGIVVSLELYTLKQIWKLRWDIGFIRKYLHSLHESFKQGMQ